MPCYRPITAYRSRAGRNKETGKWPITFKLQSGYKDLALNVPCGQCIGCKQESSRQWAMRCILEASQNKDNTFLTLTYNDDNIPDRGSLNKTDIVLFMKKLRKKIWKDYKKKIRFF